MARRGAKKVTKRQSRTDNSDADRYRDNVRPLFDNSEWSPFDSDPRHHTRPSSPIDKTVRDQKYRKNIRPQNESQQDFMDALDNSSLVMATGPAGTGKTYVAVAKAVEALEQGRVGRIVLSRPAVEAGETLGFLPGDMEEKLSPYLRPLYDALADRLSPKKVKALMAESVIEIAPIAFMRGRTLNNAYVVIDEAQNCTYGQLKMLLTRLGWHSTMVITGDPDQTDLLPGMSGLKEIVERIADLESISVINFRKKDVVRHPLVAEMIDLL